MSRSSLLPAEPSGTAAPQSKQPRELGRLLTLTHRWPRGPGAGVTANGGSRERPGCWAPWPVPRTPLCVTASGCWAHAGMPRADGGGPGQPGPRRLCACAHVRACVRARVRAYVRACASYCLLRVSEERRAGQRRVRQPEADAARGKPGFWPGLPGGLPWGRGRGERPGAQPEVHPRGRGRGLPESQHHTF